MVSPSSWVADLVGQSWHEAIPRTSLARGYPALLAYSVPECSLGHKHSGAAAGGDPAASPGARWTSNASIWVQRPQPQAPPPDGAGLDGAALARPPIETVDSSFTVSS
jgi:hypothetical protein